ncbi:MAG: hypothetical protein OEW75_13690, partial [Cyclobacteriaceae bacterium]|nr:hypothetical protein [Cyclobacteriaceae bacterium]
TGAATIGNATVVTGNFIFDFNKDAMAKALNVPDQHFRDQMLEGLTDYMTNFKKELGSPPSMQEVVDKYLESCETLFEAPIERGEFSQVEYEEMDRVDQKFNSEKWLYQFSSTPEKIKLVKVHSAVWIAQCECDTPFDGYSLFIRINERKLENVKFLNKKIKNCNENFSKLESELAGEDIENKNLFKVINTFFAQNMPKFDDNDSKILVGHIIDMWTERVKKGGYAG